MSLKNSNAITKIPKLLKNKLDNPRIKQIYKKFENSFNLKENFIVAVSGGADSLALAFLSKIYSLKNKLKSKYFIIDHKLRKDSTKEAKLVKKILQKALIKSEILTIKGKKITNKIQSSARKKRYELLFNQSRKLNFNNILLGHHLDDLFENFFIRMLRGSGLRGLISLDKKIKSSGIYLWRPLIKHNKEDLVFISKHVFKFYVNDPSNKNEKFQRIKIRNLINKLDEYGLDKKKLKLTLDNLKSSDQTIKFYVLENLKKNSFFHQKNNQLVLNKSFFKQPNEVIFRSLSDSIKMIGKKYYSARGRKLDKIIKDIKEDTSFKVTLGGCIIKKVNQTVIINKE